MNDYKIVNVDMLKTYRNSFNEAIKESREDRGDVCGADKRWPRLREHINFIEAVLRSGLAVYNGSGLYRVCANDGTCFYYGAPSRKWRIKGKSVWHKADSHEDFLQNVVINPTEKVNSIKISPEPKRKTAAKKKKKKSRMEMGRERMRRLGFDVDW